MLFTRIISRYCTKIVPSKDVTFNIKWLLFRGMHVKKNVCHSYEKPPLFRLWPSRILFGIGTVMGILCNEYWSHNTMLVMPHFQASCRSSRDRFNFIVNVVDSALPSVVTVNVILPLGDNNASGFIISQDGYILSNAHPFPMFGSFTASVTLWDGRQYPASLEAIDVDKDLALLKVNEKNLPVTKLGSSADIRVGEWVVAIGSPLHLKQTVTARVVSNAHRHASEIGLRASQTGFRKRVVEYIQTDTAITYGNSGGPLLNLDAEAIGINTMMLVPGIAFAIPIDTVKEFLQVVDAKRKGTYKEPKKQVLGMKMLSLSKEIIEALEQKNNYFLPVSTGVMVFDVFSNSPAENGGLRQGDIIIKINDKPVHYVDDIYDALNLYDVLKFKVIRNGTEVLTTVYPDVQ